MERPLDTMGFLPDPAQKCRLGTEQGDSEPNHITHWYLVYRNQTRMSFCDGKGDTLT
jgi:hypothetical protein